MQFSNKFNNFINTNKKLYWMDDVSGEIKIDLSLSENPLGCSPLVINTIRNAEYSISKYPEPTNLKLKKTLASKFNLDCTNLVIGNGIGPLIDSIFRATLDQKSEVVIPMVTFPLIEQLVRLNQGKPILVKMNKNLTTNLKALIKNINRNTSAVFICNPNNPTGELLSRKAILN
ncbi:MAG: aminotransferase class I/II-fold pyridoxal phosphate-dependent enzyme, partial [bacterium]|nr:aminotransferase class I/II-fold pyridoxal phosphate-dependent enzyme [bacterium]